MVVGGIIRCAADVYVLSIGPVVWVVRSLGVTSERRWNEIERFYTPAIWLVDSTGAGDAYTGYVHWWAGFD